MEMNRHAQRRERLLALRDLFLAELRAAALERQKREQVIEIPGIGATPAWVAYEHQRMLGAINAERAADGQPPVTLPEVERAETLAAGHVDYADKYALHCAELVMGIRC